MKILITGANGFIGNFLKTEFELKNYQIQTLGISHKNTFSVNLSKSYINLSYEYDLIIHCASIVHNHKHSKIFDTDLINQDKSISINLMKSLKNTRFKKFIFLSSVSVYGKNSGEEIKEDDKKNPISGYGFVKLFCENFFIEKIKKEKLLILRLPLVNGPNAKGNIKKLRNQISLGLMVIFKNNKSKKSILELSDLQNIIMNQNLIGCYNVKSYDIFFNDFVLKEAKNLGKAVIILPLFTLKIFKIFSKILNNSLYRKLDKVSNSLTFSNKKFLKNVKK